MKILMVMGGFFPGKKYGGPPVSADNFCSLIKGKADCYIVTHNHDMGEKTPYQGINEGWNDRGNAKVMYLSDALYGAKMFKEIVADINPDYVYLQGLFQKCVIPCLKIAKSHGIKVVLAPRGELCAGAFKKKHKKIPYILLLRIMGYLKNVIFQSTSEEETKAIHRYLGAPSAQIHLLANIPSIPHDLPDHNTKVSGAGRFVFISRILWKKNLISALRYFKSVEGNVVFDIYGPKEDEDYWKHCKDIIETLPSNVSVSYNGVLNHDDIHKTFRQYDAFLFPTLSENYGHVIAESLVSGCIPIISDQTPWNDINEADAGWALPLENESSFLEAIKTVVDMDEKEIQIKRNSIYAYLEKKMKMDVLKKDYLAIFK